MNAIVSGRAGMALLIAEDALFSIHRDRPGEMIERREDELHLLLDSARDLLFLEDVEVREVKRSLDLATAHADALHLTLIVLDATLSTGTRRQAAADLESLMEVDGVGEHLEKVLYAHPLPPSADLAGARASAADRPAVGAFLGVLESLQPIIGQVHAAWNEIPASAFGDEDRGRVLTLAVREGLFRLLVSNRQRGEAIEAFLLSSSLRPAVNRLPKSAEILQSWVVPFGEAAPPPSRLSSSSFKIPTAAANGTTAVAQAGVVRETFDQLLRRLQPRLKQILARYRVPEIDAEDLVQEVLLSTVQRWGTLDDPEIWLLVLLRNRCVVYWRERRTDLDRAVDAAILELLAEPVVAPQEKAERRWDLQILIDKLPKKCRALLRVRYGLGYDSSEVAEDHRHASVSESRAGSRCLVALTTQVALRISEDV